MTVLKQIGKFLKLFLSLKCSLFYSKMAASSNQEPQSIDFTGKSFDEKKKIVIDLIFKMCNYTDMSAAALDWSTSTMPLFVNLQMVLSLFED